MSYFVKEDYRVKKDFLKLSNSVILIIDGFIKTKLAKNPEQFGKNLSGNLKNFRSARIGSYRIIYEVKNKTIVIYVIGHRKEVYEKAKKRLGI